MTRESDARRLLKRQEAHTIRQNQLGVEARNLIDEAWSKISSKVAAANIAASFDLVEKLGVELIGSHGKRALAESANYMRNVFGFDTEPPTMADVAATVQDYMALIAEHRRHAETVAAIRVNRMQRAGVSPEVITGVVRDDFRHSREMFSMLKNSIKREVTSAINAIGKEGEWVMTPKGKQ